MQALATATQAGIGTTELTALVSVVGLGAMLGGNRMQAIYRLLGLGWLAIVTPIIATVGIIAGLAFMVVDVLLQLATGGEGFRATGSSWLVRFYEYPIAQMEWIILGKGSWMWLP